MTERKKIKAGCLGTAVLAGTLGLTALINDFLQNGEIGYNYNYPQIEMVVNYRDYYAGAGIADINRDGKARGIGIGFGVEGIGFGAEGIYNTILLGEGDTEIEILNKKIYSDRKWHTKK